MQTPILERRTSPRTSGVYGLHISHPSGTKENGNYNRINPNAMLVDLSEEGVGFVSQEPLEPFSTVLIKFDSHGDSGNVRFKSKVVWRNSEENKHGAQFLVSQKEKEFLKDLLKRVGKSFVYDKIVYLPDTNAEGNAYFARYFDWEGETREAYLKRSITKEEYGNLIKTRTRLVTVRASLDYHRPLWLFDEARIGMTTRNIRHASLEMVFTIFNKKTGELVARGFQELAFQNRRGRLIPVPPFIRRIAIQIEEESQVVVEERVKK